MTSDAHSRRWESFAQSDAEFYIWTDVANHIVLQHIPDWSAIVDYFRRVSGALGQGGVFYAQFDTRPATIAYRVKTALPDPLLPRTMQRGVRRIRRDPARIRELAASCGLTLVQELAPGTTDNVFVFARP